MQNIYIGYHFEVSPRELGSEILIAELGELPFDSFIETELGFSAYIPKVLWNDVILDSVYILKNPDFKISYTMEEVEQQNWNETWERSFEPIVVDDLCSIRAPFHDKSNVDYDIVIEPKMSFGTGHHETTFMMVQHLLRMDLRGKRVLDMGCGTAILAILAEMREASMVDAIDIDNWCYLNSIENVQRNGCENISVFEGDASLLRGKCYDVIIANINRNILVKDMPVYAGCLASGGFILLSGFYEQDVAVIESICTDNGLVFVDGFDKNGWVALQFIKI